MTSHVVRLRALSRMQKPGPSLAFLGCCSMGSLRGGCVPDSLVSARLSVAPEALLSIALTRLGGR
jgi:hypothetical protein